MKELEAINDIQQLVNCLGKDGEELDREIRLMAALKLFDLGRISSGIAARLAGMERVEFLRICGQYDVCVIQLTPEELEKEMKKFSSMDFLKQEAAKGSVEEYHAFLDAVPDAPPLPGDEC
jgi:predicted HTH domain antitoxin